MKKTTLLCLYLFASNASAMSDYELCKMLDDSGDPNGTVKYVSESYFEGKNNVSGAHGSSAQDWLETAINLAVADSGMKEYLSSSGSFISSCLESLDKFKEYMFESD